MNQQKRHKNIGRNTEDIRRLEAHIRNLNYVVNVFRILFGVLSGLTAILVLGFNLWAKWLLGNRIFSFSYNKGFGLAQFIVGGTALIILLLCIFMRQEEL